MKRPLALLLCTGVLCAGALGVPAAPVQVAPVGLGAGGYVTERPPNIIDPPDTPYRDAWEGPVPTNRWWSSLLWTAFSEPIYAGPLSYQARPEGLALGYPTLEVDETGFQMPFRADLVVGMTDFTADAARVVGYGDWTVAVRWESEAPDEARALRATLGQGLPYAYLELDGPAAIRFREPPEVWHDAPGALGVTLGGRHYAVFYPGAWTLSGASFGGPLEESGAGALVSVAALPEADEALLTRFARYAHHPPTDSRASWRWLPDEGVVEVTLTLTAPQGALMGLYPLHHKHTDAPLTELHYETPRGVMTLAETDRVTLRLPYRGVLPVLPLAAEASEALRALLDDFMEQEVFFPLFVGQTRMPDSYADGKSLGKLAALLPIAEQLGDTEAAAALLEALKERLELWFTPESLPLLYYNATWGALIAAPTSHGLDHSLNDHAFHYGYFLQAAASVAERDPAWAETWGQVVALLIRDVAAPRGDPLFPFLRALDPYLGHGWASGSGMYGRGNNLESSSEAVNFAAGLIRWADAVGDAALLELGVYLYATQTAAVWEYWLAEGGNFPAAYPHTAIGILWSDGGAYTTWWTSDPEAVHGINFLPVTASSLYLGLAPDFVRRNYHHMLVGTRPHYWPDIALSYLALADPDEALALWSPELRPEFGESRARVLHWLTSLRRYGGPEPITANAPQTAVLAKGGARTYLAYNPSGAPRTVTFADGTVLTAAPHTLTVKETP
ncbi:glycosyl hydrolase [Truepera radiovictrix]|uniref:glucan endo-1,3-beta-D-glucosidase n=1 Tax=Truepera radiovictrix (strain DSM 17093 / CIP 108686 / LMG 22925 / RQ-24) TaxID=649638 RepID=D7CRC4_TRURR|nr:glycosyl hydrolase [Truepera radiovictrix]ADI15212.1 Endo-1,3(4)-beta-glucanase [Truepera radiovictrix DSM 17093]WMT56237.1 glycosyl hydrolase [Truepera radiovictrix]